MLKARGKSEVDLADLKFPSLSIFRPGVFTDRPEPRFTENLFQKWWKPIHKNSVNRLAE